MKNPQRWLLILVGYVSCACAQDAVRPEWAKDLPNLPSRPGFYQGLGIVQSTSDADADWKAAAAKARAELAAQIRVRITSVIERTVQEKALGDQQQLSDAFQSTTQQYADATLEGVSIERWYDQDAKTFYAFAAISKEDVERRFAETAQGAMKSASILRASAERAAAQGHVYTALCQYLESVKAISLAESYLGKTLQGDVDGDGSSEPAIPFLQSRLCGLLGEVKIEIVSGNDQQSEKGRGLPQALVGRMSRRVAGSTMAVTDAILSPAFVSPAVGTLTSVCRSDSNGVFNVRVSEILRGESSNHIQVSLALPGIEELSRWVPEAARCCKDKNVVFSFGMKVRTNVRIALHILERNVGTVSAKSTVQENLQRALVKDRYTLIEESRIYRAVPVGSLDSAIEQGDYGRVAGAFSKIADYVVVGQVSTDARSNPLPQMYFCSGSATVRVIDASTGRIIASSSLQNEKEGGSNYETAGKKLLLKMALQLADSVKTSIDAALK